MRRLIVMRHGEAESAKGASDHARPLTPRGRRAASTIGRKLAQLSWSPDLGIVSDAVRTIETQTEVASILPTVTWRFETRLYLASALTTLRELAHTEQQATTLMVIGHNPGLSDLVGALCDQVIRLDTAEAALLTVDSGSWQEAFAMKGCWELLSVMRSGLGVGG